MYYVHLLLSAAKIVEVTKYYLFRHFTSTDYGKFLKKSTSQLIFLMVHILEVTQFDQSTKIKEFWR